MNNNLRKLTIIAVFSIILSCAGISLAQSPNPLKAADETELYNQITQKISKTNDSFFVKQINFEKIQKEQTESGKPDNKILCASFAEWYRVFQDKIANQDELVKDWAANKFQAHLSQVNELMDESYSTLGRNQQAFDQTSADHGCQLSGQRSDGLSNLNSRFVLGNFNFFGSANENPAAAKPDSVGATAGQKLRLAQSPTDLKSSGQPTPQTDDYQKISAADSAVIEAAKFAANEQSKINKEHYSIDSIERAEVKKDFVGKNYRICARVAGPIKDAYDDGKRLIRTVVSNIVLNTLVSWKAVSKCDEPETDETPAAQTPEKPKADADALVRAAISDNLNGRFEQAFVSLNEIIKNYPNNADAYVQRASANLNRGKPDAAADDIKTALKLDPRSSNAYVIRGALDSAKGDAAGCIADSSKAIELDPKNALAYYNRGTTYLNQGNPAQAFDDLTKAIDSGSTFAITYSNRAIASFRRGNLSDAIDDYQRALDVDPNYQIARNNLLINIKQANADDVANLINQRFSKLRETIAAYSKQGERHDSFVSTDRGNAASCQSLNELMPSFVELKTALHQTLFFKLLDPASLENLTQIIEFVKNRETEIVATEKSLNDQKIRFKCGQ